jgi:hypothetical protein
MTLTDASNKPTTMFKLLLFKLTTMFKLLLFMFKLLLLLNFHCTVIAGTGLCVPSPTTEKSTNTTNRLIAKRTDFSH